ncbi:MAG: hypothetical protein EPN39_00235 [Chitinophagaceae bacterium]|nr:MAG: hypothetical protein EPN39_00235 [Chitinophagaceae bacterium]
MKKQRIVEVISYLLLILFINVGLSKLLTFNDFRGDLKISPLLGGYANMIAIVLPVAEITVAIALLFARTRKPALVASLVMMLVFTGYALYLVFFAKDVPCSCGGLLRYMSWRAHLIFNTCFTILAAIGVWLSFGGDMPKVKGQKNYWPITE